MDIGSLIGSLVLNDEFTPKLSLALQSMQASGEAAQRVGSAFTSAGAALSIGITAPLVAASAASLSFSSTFESSMVRLVSLAGVSSGELAGVKQHILDLAPAVGIGPQALADAMTIVSSTVSDTKVALSILDIAAKGSAAGLGDTKDVAKALTSVINSYGSENITAARAADILTKAVQDGGAEAKELAPTIANVVPIAAQLGVSFEEVAANIATVTKLGVPAGEAVTQLSAVFTAMLKETKQGTDALAKYGIGYDDLRRSVKENGLQATLDSLVKTFGANKTGLTDVFGRIEALRNVMSSAGQQSKTYAEEIDRIRRSSEGLGAATEANNAVQGTQAQTWAQVSAAIGVAAIKFGDALAPAMKSVLEAAKPIVSSIISLADWFAKLPAPVQSTVIALGAVAAAVGPVVFGVGAVITGVASLMKAAGSLDVLLLSWAGTNATVAASQTALAAATVPATVAIVAQAEAVQGDLFATLANDLVGAGQQMDLLAGAANTAAISQTAFAGATTEATAVTVTATTVTGTMTAAVSRLWAIVAAHPLVAVTAAVGALTYAFVQWYAATQNAELASQTAAAKQDVINAAIEHGASSTIEYADAVKYQTEWLRALNDPMTSVNQALKQLTDNGAPATQQAQLLSDSVLRLSESGNLGAAQIADFADKIKALNIPVTDLPPALKNIVLALQNTSKGVQLASGNVKLSSEQLKANAAEAKKTAEAWEQYKSVAINVYDQLGEAVVEAIKSDLNRKFSQTDLARVYGVTAAQIDAVQKVMEREKDTAKISEEIHGKLEHGLAGLNESIGNVDTSELKWVKTQNDHVAVMNQIIALNLQARDGFNNSAIALENIGQHSTDPDKVKQKVEELANTVGGHLQTALAAVPQLLIQAFTGGGGLSGAIKAIGTMIATEIMEPLIKGFSRAQKEAIGFGSGVTTAIGAASGLGQTTNTIVGIGTGLAAAAIGAQTLSTGLTVAATIGTVGMAAMTLGIGAAAIGVIALVKHFKGVSEEIKEARKTAEDFESQIWNTLSTTQLMEAGNQRWAAPVIGVRDTYLAVGLSAEQAEADVQALWDATNQGPEAVKAAMDKISAAFNRQKEILDAIHAAGWTTQKDFQALADKAKAVYDYMVQTGQYSASQLAEAFRASAEAQARAMGDAAQFQADSAADAGYKTRAEYEETAKKAQETYEYMRDSGLYTAAEVEKAWKATQDAQTAAYGEATSAITGLVNQYKTLADSVSDEAPEEIMGVIEAQTRAQMQVLKDQGEEQLRLSGMTAEQAAAEWERQLNGIQIDPVHVPIVWDAPPLPHGSTEAPERNLNDGSHAAYGGYVSQSGIISSHLAQGGFGRGPSGSDTRPVWVTPTERILSPSQSVEYDRRSNTPSETHEIKDSIDGLVHAIINTLPRSIARQIGTELVGLRTA